MDPIENVVDKMSRGNAADITARTIPSLVYAKVIEA